ncbi:MAG: NB-ARC domain-containing protein [Chloroflexota bacterium]
MGDLSAQPVTPVNAPAFRDWVTGAIGRLAADQDRRQAQPLIAFLQAELPEAFAKGLWSALLTDSEPARAARELYVVELATQTWQCLNGIADSVAGIKDSLSDLRQTIATVGPGAGHADGVARGLQGVLDAVDESGADTRRRIVEALVPHLSRLDGKLDRLADEFASRAARPADWVAPRARRPSRVRIDCHKFERGLVAEALRAGEDVAICGAAGVGKTWLADLVAFDLDTRFPAGVLVAQLGQGRVDSASVADILGEWVAWAFGGPQEEERLRASAAAVRATLARNAPGTVLIVLDDAWHQDALDAVLDARPPNSVLLLSTRNQELARRYVMRVRELGVLDPEREPGASVALLRLGNPRAQQVSDEIVARLAATLGHHPLALDLVGRRFQHVDIARWPGEIDSLDAAVRDGTVFSGLALTDGSRADRRFEASLWRTYSELDETARARLRALGTLAPDASFATKLAVIIWDCADNEAFAQLSEYSDLGLVGATSDGRWNQHGLVRAYALALSARLGEADAARQRHADGVRRWLADVGPEEPRAIVADHAQLEHAFDWILARDAVSALQLADEGADLQADFSLAPVSYRWAMALWASVRESGDADLKGATLGTLGRAAARLSAYGGEDRRARLAEALGACEEALRFYTAERAPLDYAMTQNNRGNVLSDLAGESGEDRRARLEEALGAYGEALRFLTAERAPLQYAGTQNNRGNVLRDLAGEGGEDRRARLEEALGAYGEALRFYTAERAPRDYAMTQNNRGPC